MKKCNSYSSVLVNLGLAVTVLFSAIGCGGSGTTSTANPYAGTYSSNITLDSGKLGAVALSVTSTGSASGTLAVTSPPAARGRDGGFSFSVGTHTISGKVGSDGTISLSGTDTGSTGGNFTVGGQITGTGTGNVSILAGGTTYSGSLSGSNGGGSITLTSGSGSNAIMSNFPANPLVLMSTVGDFTSIVAAPPAGGNARTLTLLLGADATPGSTITYDGNPSSANSLQYGEGGTKAWMASSGTATVAVRTSGTIQITFNNVTMTAEADTGATGTFILNGTLTK